MSFKRERTVSISPKLKCIPLQSMGTYLCVYIFKNKIASRQMLIYGELELR